MNDMGIERRGMEVNNLIGGSVLGLLYIPDDYAAPRGGWFNAWRRHVVANAGPRNRDYMERLFRDRFAGGDLIHMAADSLPIEKVEKADAIVLLYPDSIGLDVVHIERAIASRWPLKRVFALNGRRRFFLLDASMRRRLAIRRFLETFRIPEVILISLFIATTPLLVLWDFLRGHR